MALIAKMQMNNSKGLVTGWSMLLLMLCCSLLANGASQHDSVADRVNHRDSLLFLHTVKVWSDSNWDSFEDYSKMYKMTNSSVAYSVDRVFYSPDKLKMIAWISSKIPNAPTIEPYTGNPELDKVCPKGPDTVYDMIAIVGFRSNPSAIWNLYPFGNETGTCYSNVSELIKLFESYYYHKMSSHQMDFMAQAGSSKGKLALKSYGRNLNDSTFWEESMLWQKDTVGANGLYPFQIATYDYPVSGVCNKCAGAIVTPKVNYPKEILELFK